MPAAAKSFGQFLSFAVLAIALGLSAAYAQDESVSEIRYKEDYDQVQKIAKTAEPAKRSEQLLSFYKGRADMDPKIREYADNIFARDLESLLKQSNYTAMRGLAERALKTRPNFGEAYFFLGVSLKFDKKIDEAMNAFAKCYLIKNSLQPRAKQLLDTTYRSANRGSLTGEDKILKKAMSELK